jgi:glycerol-3-phosphate dehydrogenase
VDDSRLVVLNARDAADRGAAIRTRTKAIAATRGPNVWHLTTVDGRSGGPVQTVRARILVNAAGPWVGDVLAVTQGRNVPASIRLVQGSHIVVPRLYTHDRCYIFQNSDKRIIFAIPYEGDFTLIGTTENDYVGDPGEVRTSAEDIDYLCRAVNQYFSTTITPAQVVWTYSGVRPLYDDGASEAQAATRDYVLDLDEAGAPLLSIFGGKITTIDAWRSTHSTNLNVTCLQMHVAAATGPAKYPCRAATFRCKALILWSKTSGASILGWARSNPVVWPELTARKRAPSSMEQPAGVHWDATSAMA